METYRQITHITDVQDHYTIDLHFKHSPVMDSGKVHELLNSLRTELNKFVNSKGVLK